MKSQLKEASLYHRSREAGPAGDLIWVSRAAPDFVQDPLLVRAEISDVLSVFTFPWGFDEESGGAEGR